MASRRVVLGNFLRVSSVTKVEIYSLGLGQRVGQWVACKRAVPVCFVKTAQWLRKAGTAGGACWIRDDAKAQVEALGLHGMPSPWSTRTPIRADQTGLRGRDSRDLSKPLVPEDDRFVPKGPAVHNASPETPMASVFGEIPAGADLHVGIEGFSLPPVAPAKTWQGRAGQGRARLQGEHCKYGRGLAMRQPTAQVGRTGERAHGAVPVSVQGRRESGCVGGFLDRMSMETVVQRRGQATAEFQRRRNQVRAAMYTYTCHVSTYCAMHDFFFFFFFFFFFYYYYYYYYYYHHMVVWHVLCNSRRRLLARHHHHSAHRSAWPRGGDQALPASTKGAPVCLQLPNRSSRPARRCSLPRRAASARRLARAHPEPYEAFAARLKHSCHVSDTRLGTPPFPAALFPIPSLPSRLVTRPSSHPSPVAACR
ncbi:hypothetical protein PSV08DRAFT_243197 [Bipolaris maydis]|uniref:uncharacterized protein n=1 Tax=Cochliobolus heterostrophus TaxID=5016 RepID=UPI0024DCE344|nr:hypothetical protein PSV08DRAFT_243197 [Bipolaris maydis]